MSHRTYRGRRAETEIRLTALILHCSRIADDVARYFTSAPTLMQDVVITAPSADQHRIATVTTKPRFGRGPEFKVSILLPDHGTPDEIDQLAIRIYGTGLPDVLGHATQQDNGTYHIRFGARRTLEIYHAQFSTT